MRSSGPRPGVSREQFDARVKQLAGGVKRLEDKVEQEQNNLENRKARLGKVFHRAQTALNLGLAGEALQILRGSDVTAFGPEGMQMQIELALHMGLVRDVRAWFDDAEATEKQEKDFILNLVQPKESLQDGRAIARYYRFKGLLA